MATKAKNFAEYIREVVATAGSDTAVAKHLGFSDGSRVGLWRQGRGRGSELACVKLARWTGDDPLDILRLAGYDEMAGLLDGTVQPSAPPDLAAVRPQLKALREMLDAALKITEEDR